MDKTSATPMMKQWHGCKEQAKDAIVFFRLGDFYEAFYEDAERMAAELGLTLTSRQNIPMCGVPVQVAEQYLDKLLAKGFKVAIAEQMEEASAGKGIVPRKIVRFLSPGSVIQSRLLSDHVNNFFMSISEISGSFAIGIVDISTAEFRVLATTEVRELISEICRLRPVELLVSKTFAREKKAFLAELSEEFSFLLNTQEDRFFSAFFGHSILERKFSPEVLEELGLTKSCSEVSAAGALLYYLKDRLCLDLAQIQTLEKDPFTSFMSIDKTCLRNLNILPDKNVKFSLVDTLDETLTPMGARLFRSWLKRPLLLESLIEERYDAVEELTQKGEQLEKIRRCLSGIRDLERLVTKISSAQASPKDFIALKMSLQATETLRAHLFFESKLLKLVSSQMASTTKIIDMLEEMFVETPPFRLHDGPCFRKGHHPPLDELYEISTSSKSWIANYQERLRKELGIKTLKVGFTKAFGYYIDVSKAQASKVPDSFVRRQTLTNSERFLSPELKELEYKILSAEDRIKAIEKTLFTEAKERVALYFPTIFSVAKAVAVIDTTASFANTAVSYHYTRPRVTSENALHIEGGRHPILERSLAFSHFIPNDTIFSKETRLLLITGPNMAGKSTYIRQTALLVILAQAGCFVPASSFVFRPIDQIFSRIGAADDIAAGQSTFMVEMRETAAILQHATRRSLIILDELGRGTSTYDGIAIAWAVIEFLIEKTTAKTLFATHYRELTHLEKQVSGVSNWQVAVEEGNSGVIFLHKIIRGASPQSYAIHVAKLAGLPKSCLERASSILQQLEKEGVRKSLLPEVSEVKEKTPKKNLAWIEEIANLNVQAMSPMEAHEMLFTLQKQIGLL